MGAEIEERTWLCVRVGEALVYTQGAFGPIHGDSDPVRLLKWVFFSVLKHTGTSDAAQIIPAATSLLAAQLRGQSQVGRSCAVVCPTSSPRLYSKPVPTLLIPCLGSNPGSILNGAESMINSNLKEEEEVREFRSVFVCLFVCRGCARERRLLS